MIVINRNFADPRFGKALIQAKKNGADVTVVLEEGTGSFYTYYAERWLTKFQKQGIKLTTSATKMEKSSSIRKSF